MDLLNQKLKKGLKKALGGAADAENPLAQMKIADKALSEPLLGLGPGQVQARLGRQISFSGRSLFWKIDIFLIWHTHVNIQTGKLMIKFFLRRC